MNIEASYLHLEQEGKKMRTSLFGSSRHRAKGSRAALAAKNGRLKARLAAACAELETAEARERARMMNVLRHAVPTQCIITLEQNSSEASLSMVNDGADAAMARVRFGGTGLAGLSRLLAEQGGRLSAGHESGCFTLRATVAIAASTSGAALRALFPHPRRPAAGQLPLLQ